MKKNKKIIIIVFGLLIFIGITLAYVVGQISDGALGNANITADTTDNLQFSVDKDISLNPTQFNVPEGGGGLSDTAVGTATLLANSTNKTATYDYYVYFNIKSNNYTYTTEEQKPEIVLTITDPTGEAVTSIEGLTYITTQNADGSEVKGFDITTKSDIFNVTSNYEITSNSSTDATVQDWTFTVTFINLTTNQSDNGGSTLDAEIILSKDEKYTLANYIINKVYVEDGVNGLYCHDGQGNYENAELEAEDNSYRYAGANPNNYVCFGSNDETCPEENLYRTIGVFENQVKLIKNSNYLNLPWDESDPEFGFPYGSNEWNNSTLKENLNNNYLKNLGYYSKFIYDNTSWILGEISTSNLTPKDVYLLETGKNTNAINVQTDKGLIGLMYVSDYGYAASPTYWTYVFHDATGVNQDYRDAITENWLYSGKSEWTLTIDSNTNSNVYSLYGSGKVDRNGARNAFMIRPVMFLKNNVIYISGTGTSTDPYRIA